MQVVTRDSGRIILRFDPGEEVIAKLQDFCVSENIRGAWISGLGSSRETILSFYNLENRMCEDRTFSERLEVVNLTGNISRLGERPVVHLHGTVADSNFVVKGGHVKKLIVSATCEISLVNIPRGIERIYDEQTGLNILK